jgi:hypothetical protein
MRSALPCETLIEDKIILILKLSEDDLRRILPIKITPEDPLATVEPSISGLGQLESGQYFAVLYGLVTKQLMILKSKNVSEEELLSALFSEAPELQKYVTK